MTDSADPIPSDPPKRRGKLILLGMFLALILGAGGFYASWSGLILPPPAPEAGLSAPAALTDIAFVPVDPIVISLPPGSRSRHLKLTAQLEVIKPTAAEVTMLMPRILDVLNSYLRAVDMAQVEDPGAIARLRAQMLRRVQIVTGEGRVRDLLITEFLLD